MSVELSARRIDVGKKGDPHQPVVNHLTGLGVPIYKKSVDDLRSGRYSGRQIANAVDCRAVLRDNDASWKDNLYLEIANWGIRLRKKQRLNDPHRFTSRGLTASVAERLSIDVRDLARCIVSMRQEIAFLDTAIPETEVYSWFLEIYQSYLQTHLIGRPMRSGFAEALVHTFPKGPQHIANFYRFAYNFPPGKDINKPIRPIIATFFTHELEMFQDFFSRQNTLNNPMTPYDRFILEQSQKRRPFKEMCQEILERTGVPIDKSTIICHRNLLLHGQFVKPEIRPN